MKKIIYNALASLIISVNITCATHKAVIIIPVADLISQPFGNQHNSSKHILQRYKTLPVRGGKYKPFESCPRMHQALYNEIVTVHAQQGDEVCVSISNMYYQTPGSNIKNTRYWTHQKNIRALKLISDNKINTNTIPSPINFQNKRVSPKKYAVATLIQPWHDQISQRTFSAGTRFVCAKINKQKCTIHLINPTATHTYTADIPATHCILSQKRTPKQKVDLMVKVLKHWANNPNGFIPYVWGGISYTQLCHDNNFVHKSISLCDTTREHCYVRPDGAQFPKCGLDCTGLAARAAQICEIPYFCKNTHAVQAQLKPLGSHTIENGDIIWIDKHVMIVSDIDKNLLIEARNYPHGYGKIHEIALNKVFKGINTYNDLRTAYTKEKKLKRLDIHGNVAEIKPPCIIYKLASVF